MNLAATLNLLGTGTSEGAIKGWETRRTGGASPSQASISPNEREGMKIEDALKALKSPEQAAMVREATDLVNKISPGGTVSSTLGSWKDGAENSIVVGSVADYQTSRYMAAKLGLSHNQKSVGVFHAGDGSDTLWRTVIPKSYTPHEISATLDKHGISDRTLIPRKDGTEVRLIDVGSQMRNQVKGLVQEYGVKAQSKTGKAESIGGDTREEGAHAYRQIIDSYEGSMGRAMAGGRDLLCVRRRNPLAQRPGEEVGLHAGGKGSGCNPVVGKCGRTASIRIHNGIDTNTGYRKIIATGEYGRQIGYIIHDGYEGRPETTIFSVKVDPEFRNYGIGEQLYRAAIEDARAMGSKQFKSDTAISPEAQRVWRKLVQSGDYNITEKDLPDGRPTWTVELGQAHSTARDLHANRKLHKRIVHQGMHISVENRAGSVRSGVDPTGKTWRTKMQHDYGYVKGSKGLDGGGVDCFVGPNPTAKMAYVVHIMKPPDFTKFDEDKCMLGFNSAREAKKALLVHYDSPKFFGSMERMPVAEFRQKAMHTGAHGPMKIQADAGEPNVYPGGMGHIEPRPTVNPPSLKNPKYIPSPSDPRETDDTFMDVSRRHDQATEAFRNRLTKQHPEPHMKPLNKTLITGFPAISVGGFG